MATESLTLAVAVACAVALAACGSGGSSGATTSGSDTGAGITFARCMRAHRVPSFPDPVTFSASRSTDALVEGGMMFPIGSTVNPQSPAFERAAAACGQGRPVGQPKGG
jgi:hypothetical protein